MATPNGGVVICRDDDPLRGPGVNVEPSGAVPSCVIRNVLPPLLALLLVGGCGGQEPRTAPTTPPASAAFDPSPAPESLLGPWRPAPVSVGDDLEANLQAACAEQGSGLGIAIDELPVALVDARGDGRATVVLADEFAAALCEATIAADGLGVTVDRPPGRLVPDALDPIAEDAIRVTSYVVVDEESAPRTQILGRVGRQAFEVIAAFDNESEVYATRSNGWFAAWWPGAVDAATIAAVDRQNLVIASAPIPDGDLVGTANVARWWLDPAVPPPGPDATSIAALIQEEACASGRSPKGRVLEPQLFSSSDAILVTVWVRDQVGGQDCQGNPTFPLEISLTEPLGERRLLDGSEVPPRDATVPPE